MSDKLDVNLGYVYKNVVAQILTTKGYHLFYYTINSETSNHLYEIDFLISNGNKICPIEVKSGNYREHKSLNLFCEKFSSRIKDKYVVHTKDFNGRMVFIIFLLMHFLFLWNENIFKKQNVKTNQKQLTIFFITLYDVPTSDEKKSR